VTAARSIDRSRLLARMDEERRHRITVLVAPAGYGKSTLLREFLARGSRTPVPFYRVRSERESPIGFARGVLDAIGGVIEVPPLHEYAYVNGVRDRAALRDWLLRALAPFSGTIVVDDLHLATWDRASAEFVAGVIDGGGHAIRWIVATRSVARLPVASWRARGEVGEPIGQADLGLTAEESVRLSRAHGLEVSDEIIDHVAGLARGWPAAFAFGIRLAAKGIAAARVATYTRAFVDDLFAEQVLARLRPEQRDFLLDTSLVRRVDPEVLRGRYRFDPEAMLRSLQREASFVEPDESRGYVYHDLFRDFLRRAVRAEPAPAIAARVRRVAFALLDAGEPHEALALCVDMAAIGVTVEILERVGFRLIDCGYVDVAGHAAARLEAAGERHPIVAGIRATLESMHGNDVHCEELFARAIAGACGELATELRIKLATHRLNRRDAAGAAQAVAGTTGGGRLDLQVGLATIDACIKARLGDPAARARLEDAVLLLRDLVDETQIAVAHHQVALVLYLLGEFERARSYASSAVAIAERQRVAGVAGRARSVLSAIAAEVGNPAIQRRINRELFALAQGAQDPKLEFFSLANLFIIEIEAGRLAAARTVEAELRQFDATQFRDSEEALYPAYALRAAWEGDFGLAYAFVRGTDAALSPETRRLLRTSEIALYAVACGDVDEALRAATAGSATLESFGGDRRTMHSRALTSRILLGLTYALLGDGEAAASALSHLRYANAVQRRTFERFAAAARAFVRAGRRDDRDGAAIARLRDSELGGYAMLIDALANVPAQRGAADRASTLTSAERAVLDRLSRGLTSKEIAAAFGRSRYTIDTQVKSIVRKFGCSGRSEAVYLARRLGILD